MYAECVTGRRITLGECYCSDGSWVDGMSELRGDGSFSGGSVLNQACDKCYV